MTDTQIAPNNKLTVELSAQDWADLNENTFVDPEFVRCAVVEGTIRRVQWSLDDIVDVQGHVTATFNHTDNPKLKRRLCKLSDTLQRLLDEYEDYSED